MNAELLQQIAASGGIVNLSSRAKFRFTGADRIRYLNGQVTNDVRQSSGHRTLYACITDAKGRITSDAFIHSSIQGDAIFVDAEPDLREVLGPRLERYIIADDVELCDVTDDWQLWHVFGPAATAFTAGNDHALASNRLGIEGCDVWCSSPPSIDCPVLSETDFETLRIIRGIPRCPHELNNETFPPEAGLESRAMSYTKGCYIGQEVLSRIRTTGKMPRQLVQWRSKTTIAVGEHVFSATEPTRSLGTVSSATWHPTEQMHVGLAFVKQGSVEPHSELPAGHDQPRIGALVEIFAFVN